MNSIGKSNSRHRLAVCVILVMLALVAGSDAQAQVQGSNTVYSGTSTLKSSNSFIDAGAFALTGDICDKINAALMLVNGTTLKGGTVIDARGVGSGTTQNCHINPFLSPTTAKPAKVLLPSGTIIMSTQWIIPDQTQLFGEGPQQTILQAGSSFSGASMLQMGYSDCTTTSNTNGFTFAVQIQHLTLDGQGKSIDGIDNCNSEEQANVDDVVILRVEKVGLFLGTDKSGASQGTANHSGPYTNIVVQANYGGATTSTATACVVISSAQPRGIHGLTCIANATPKAAVYLDGQNVSLEDVRIDGFVDGILAGDLSNLGLTTVFAEGNLIFNVNGTANVATSLIHIAAAAVAHVSGQPYECPPTIAVSSTAYSVCNLTVMGVTGGGGTNIIKDDITGTNLAYSSTNPAVNMYVLGQEMGNTSSLTPAQYSRFTTSPIKPTWAVGTTALSGTPACSAPGALYSNTNGTAATGTLWTCVTATPNPTWLKVQ